MHFSSLTFKTRRRECTQRNLIYLRGVGRKGTGAVKDFPWLGTFMFDFRHFGFLSFASLHSLFVVVGKRKFMTLGRIVFITISLSLWDRDNARWN